MATTFEEFSQGDPVQIVMPATKHLEDVATKKENYFQRVGADLSGRFGDIIKTYQRAAKGQDPLSTGIQTVGAVAGGVGDIIGEAISPVISGVAKSAPIQYLGEKISDIPAVQKIASEGIIGKGIESGKGMMEKYKAFKDKYPEAAANLESTVNIASLFPIEKVASVGVKGAIKAGEELVGAAGKATKFAGKTLKIAGEGAYGVGVGLDEATKLALQSYEATQPSLLGRVKNFIIGEKVGITKPITEANTAARKGLVGTEWQLGVQAKKVAKDVWSNIIKPALQATKEKISMPSFLDDLKSDIMKTADLNRRNTLLDALDNFSESYKKVGKFGIEKLQSYKEGWAKFIPEATYKGKPIGGSLNEIRNLAAQKARQIIYEKLGPEVKQAYLDYGNLLSIEKAGIKSIDLLRSKGMTKQVWEFIIDKAVTPVATFGGQVLYKTGEGLEFLGSKGAKSIKDILESTAEKAPVPKP